MIFTAVNFDDDKSIEEMSSFASSIIKDYYDPIIGSEQNDYMIKKFQSAESIKEQISKGYEYYFVCNKNKRIGFLAFYKRENELYLSKFYLEKTERGKGYSRLMMDFVKENAKKNNLPSVTLNVNKFNVSKYVYEKLGFSEIRKEKNYIGNGFFMDDYVYEYKL